MNFWNKVQKLLKSKRAKPKNEIVKPKNGAESKRETKGNTDVKPDLVHIPKGYEGRYTPEFIAKSKARKKAKRRAQRESRKINRK